MLLLVGGDPAVIHTFMSPNEQAQGVFGRAVAAAGDVDGDGLGDVLVGAHRESPGASPNHAGRAYLFSGDDGSLLHTLISPNEEGGGCFGWSISGAGDVTGDDLADVIVGAYGEDPGASPDGSGRAYLFDGQTGTLVRSLTPPNGETAGYFGWSVSGLGDVDGDGHADVVVGAPWEDQGPGYTNAGRAYVFSGSSGVLLHTLASPVAQDSGYFGWCVSGIGDVDGDGAGDVIVGAHKESPGASPHQAGRVYVFSGAAGTLIHTFASPNEEQGGWFGFWVSRTGDVDGDGRTDVLIGAYNEDPGGSPTNAGRAYAFSSFSGGLVYTLVSPNEEDGGFFGYAVSGAGDVDCDGYPDIAVGAPGEGPAEAGRAYLFNGNLGGVISELTSLSEEYKGYFGCSVSGIAGWGGEVEREVVIGACWEDPGAAPTNAGRAYRFSPPLILSGRLAGGELCLQWTPCPRAAAYWVYGTESEAYFEPGLAPGYEHRLAVISPLTLTWASPNGIGDPDSNWAYLIIAADAAEQEICRSNRFGEFDFDSGNGAYQRIRVSAAGRSLRLRSLRQAQDRQGLRQDISRSGRRPSPLSGRP